MSIPQQAGSEHITGKAQLVAYLAAGAKPREDWRIGVEHEKFPFHLTDLSPVPYAGEEGIGALLRGLTRFGWQEIKEQDTVIGLSKESANISLEPGGQFELSGAALKTIPEIEAELKQHFAEANEVAAALGIGFLNCGFHPAAKREEIPFMPKGRYAIMRAYMPKCGTRGLDMMQRTCTAQVNLDFGDEADMIAKLRVSLKLQPIATALFANSPFIEGKTGAYVSERAAVWQNVDPERTGFMPFVFDEDFCFARYVDYALDVPMYFVFRDGRYIDASGQSFRDFLAGKLAALPGVRPTLTDWADHLTTIFTDVRLKRYIEMRGADVGDSGMILALAALWTGLLYDPAALAAAGELAATISLEALAALKNAVPKYGLDAEAGGLKALSITREMLAIADAGLKARGLGEERYLAPLAEICASGRSPAARLRDAYAGEWGGDMTSLYKLNRY
jgi:glutamate--cysteine ligase